MSSPALECRALTVTYGGPPVLDGVDLLVGRGEVLAVLGPSGSGKTTLLYAIAGFVPPTAGEIHIGGQPVASAARQLPPERRRVGVVFQHYALWPHLTALDNVAYPLRRAGADRATARARARELLASMDIAALADRRPAELSGGQQQRVGVARALARDADLYLFDEPTAHLDTTLRERLAQEMGERQRERDAATVYATHDWAEALSLADRVALLRDGRVIQVGAPHVVFERPVDPWAARLTGPASLLRARVVVTDSGPRVALGDRLAGGRVEGPRLTTDAEVTVVVRPGWAHLDGPLAGTVRRTWFRGPHTDHAIETAAGEVVVRHPGTPRAVAGETVTWGLDRAWVVDGPAT